LEKGMTEEDFKEMAAEGVRLVAEIGGGGAYEIQDVKPMVEWAKKYGMKINVHFGARFLLGSANILAKDVLAIDPDVAVHVNGGSTAPPFEEFKKLADQGSCALEFIHNGNPKATYEGIKYLSERDMLRRVTVGSDSPVGIGVIPLAILRIVVQISSMNGIPGAKVLAFATGNTAKAYGLRTGKIQEGLDADLLLMDAPCDSVAKDALSAIEAGDNPAITMVMIDGCIVTDRARNTAATDRTIEINGLPRNFTSLDEFLRY
jgi:enamidase